MSNTEVSKAPSVKGAKSAYTIIGEGLDYDAAEDMLAHGVPLVAVIALMASLDFDYAVHEATKSNGSSSESPTRASAVPADTIATIDPRERG